MIARAPAGRPPATAAPPVERAVELEGTVRLVAAVVAPLTGRRCALYHVQLSALQRVLERDLRRAGREVAGAPFLLLTERGTLLVDPAEARLSLGAATWRRVVAGRDPETHARLEALYGRLGRRRRSAVVAHERRVDEGDVVFVAGALVARPDPGGAARGYRHPPTLCVLRAHELLLVRRPR